VRDDDCGEDRNGPPEGLNLPTTGSSSDLGILLIEGVGVVCSFARSDVDCAISSSDRACTCALSLAGESGLSGASLSSVAGKSRE
jgi:hypothetical protein